MRKAPAYHEAKLWKLLRDRRLERLKFRRQVPLGPYIADFVYFRHRLIIEADGPAQLTNVEHDRARDAWLLEQGFRVLRFPNALIATDRHGVLSCILEAVTPS
jgi:very-short-patch-repair endonuclease